jgi:tryptophan synthase alpha chain
MGKNRISDLFQKLKQHKRSGLGIFITAGDPNIKISQSILNELPKNGADFIELGMPFSDPMADGPVIQASSLRALNAGMNLSKILLMVKNFRKINNYTPIILMGYYNPIFNFGVEKFVRESKIAGVDGFIVVDLPPEEDKEFFDPVSKSDLDFIRLITPTTDANRLKIVLKKSSGFLYYVTITGTTGTKKATIKDIKNSLSLINKFSDLPVAVGFGITTKKQISEISEIADAAVVGSHIVKFIENSYSEHNSLNDSTVLNIQNEVKHLSSGIKILE